MDPSDKVISREQAKAQGLKRYYTGKKCLRGHQSERLISTFACITCMYEARTKFDRKNPKFIRARRKRYVDKNLDYWRSYSNSLQTKKRTGQKIVDYTVRDAIIVYYWFARYLTRFTGVKHHVDHVVPLQGENFCGLHHPNNLQILPAQTNLKKGNKVARTKSLRSTQHSVYDQTPIRDEKWPNQS